MKLKIISVCILIALAILLSGVAFGQTQIQKLTLNQPVERQIKGGETHSLEFEVKAGFYGAGVEQKGIDVIVSLFASNGKRFR